MKIKRMALATLFALLVMLVTAFIFWNSAKVATESAEASGGIVNAIVGFFSFFGLEPNADTLSFFVRKTGHFLEYFGLSVFVSLFILSTFEKRRTLVFAPIYALLVAIIDEFFVQAITEGRSPEFRDVLIDLSGAAIAVVVILIIIQIFKNGKKPSEE